MEVCMKLVSLANTLLSYIVAGASRAGLHSIPTQPALEEVLRLVRRSGRPYTV